MDDFNSATFTGVSVLNPPMNVNKKDMIIYDFVNSNNLNSFNSVANMRGNTLDLVLPNMRAVSVNKTDSIIETTDPYHPPLNILISPDRSPSSHRECQRKHKKYDNIGEKAPGLCYAKADFKQIYMNQLSRTPGQICIT